MPSRLLAVPSMLVAVFVLCALVLAPAAHAGPVRTSSSASGSGVSVTGSATGSANIFINSAREINVGNTKRRLTFDARADNGAFIKRFVKGKVNCTQTVCSGATLKLQPPAGAGQLGTSAQAGSDINRRMADRIGMVNTCAVGSPVLFSNDANCQKRDAYNLIHAMQPGVMRDMPMGIPTHLTVRVWRDCRVDPDTLSENPQSTQRYASGDELERGAPGVNAALSNGGQSCTVDPIFERTIAKRSASQTRRNFFFVREVSSIPVNTADSSYDVFRARNANFSVGGPAYSSCTTKARIVDGIDPTTQARTKKRCTWAAQYLGAGGKSLSAAQVNQRCENGGIAGRSVNWSREELLSEINGRYGYLNSRAGRGERGKTWNFFRSTDRRDALNAWVEARANGGGNALPPGFRTGSVEARTAMCDALSEWLAFDWSISDTGGGKGTVTMNTIPGRLYVVQMVFTDSRENIISQTVNTFSSRNSSVCTPPTSDCPEVNCDGSSARSCGDDEPPVVRSDPRLGDLNFETARGALNGAPSEMLLRSNARDEGTSNQEESAEGRRPTASLWSPRAAAFTVQLKDEGSNRASYDKNEILNILGGPATRRAPVVGGLGHLVSPTDPEEAPVQNAILNVFRADGAQTVQSDKAPLFVSATTGEVTAKASAVQQRPTRVPTKDDPEGIRANSNRFATLLGEQRWLQSMSNASARSRYQWERVTMDRCSGDSVREEKLNEVDGEDIPEIVNVPVRSYARFVAEACDSNKRLADSWRVSDAYKIQPISTGGGEAYQVTALISQDETGPARIQLDGPLGNHVVQANLWSVEDWLSRSREDAITCEGEDQDCAPTAGVDQKYPLYTDRGTMGQSELNFCERRRSRREAFMEPFTNSRVVGHETRYREPLTGPLSVTHYLNSPGTRDENGQPEVWPKTPDGQFGLGPRFLPGFTLDDPNKTYWRAFLDGDRFDQTIGGAGPDRLFRYSGGASNWGRGWWWTAKDESQQRPGMVLPIVSPYEVEIRENFTDYRRSFRIIEEDAFNCPVTGSSYAVTDGNRIDAVNELPEGDYVVQFLLQGDRQAATPWGIRAKVMRNPTSSYVTGFTFNQQRIGTSVFRARTVG